MLTTFLSFIALVMLFGLVCHLVIWMIITILAIMYHLFQWWLRVVNRPIDSPWLHDD